MNGKRGNSEIATVAKDLMGWTSMERAKSKPVAMLPREVKRREVMRSSWETREKARTIALKVPTSPTAKEGSEEKVV